MTDVLSFAHNTLVDLASAKRENHLIDIMKDFSKACRFCDFQLAPGPFNPSLDPAALLRFGSYNPEWKKQYATEPSCKHDPARAQAVLRAGSVQWARAFAHVRDPFQKSFVERARAQGFKDGVTTPIHGPQGCVAILMFAARQRFSLNGEEEEALGHIAIALHQRVRRLTAAALVATPQTVELTTREIECLHWVLEGKTNWEIGVVMGVTARTVQFHLGNAARKLGVFNRVQAAVGALIRGDISVSALRHNECELGSAKIDNYWRGSEPNSSPSKFSPSLVD